MSGHRGRSGEIGGGAHPAGWPLTEMTMSPSISWPFAAARPSGCRSVTVRGGKQRTWVRGSGALGLWRRIWRGRIGRSRGRSRSREGRSRGRSRSRLQHRLEQHVLRVAQLVVLFFVFWKAGRPQTLGRPEAGYWGPRRAPKLPRRRSGVGGSGRSRGRHPAGGWGGGVKQGGRPLSPAAPPSSSARPRPTWRSLR